MVAHPVPVKLNQVLTGTIRDMTLNGLGRLYVTDDYPLKIEDAIPGEEVEVIVTQVDRWSGYAKITKWLKTSDQRQNQDRQYLLDAGTAPLVNWSYPAQLALKRQQVAQIFQEAGLQVEVTPVVGMDQPTYYRNKTVVPLKWQDGQLLSGFYQRGSHRLVPMEDYYVNDRRLDQVIVTVREILARHQVSAFDPDTQTGTVRYLMVRRGYYSQELMVVLVVNQEPVEHLEAVVADIVAALPDLTSLILNLSPKVDYVLLSPHNRTLWGQGAIHDRLLGQQFIIGPNSFYQVNPVMTEKLYQLAAQAADLNQDDIVIDAYAGIGTIGISVAKQVKQVLGVEVVPGAVADAQANAALNHLTNVSYILADAPKQFVAWQQAGIHPDVVMVDPPRRGLTQTLIEATVAMGPERVVYISCNPVTAARDAAIFDQLGYQVSRPIIPVDQFPQTSHIETITVLTPKAAKKEQV
ncbi:23S rRNA (uracil(1939)-C(5))-methyltransferase RlmD [Leuconostocaceae bacterium ESL0723]|nr:23S rRNA (uracil(1939)-C(5))-methyltransferase RlmD [Leuconostocaceae bacterium ESL0723]